MSQDELLLELLNELKARNYRFVTVTPCTHAAVLSLPIAGPPTLQDIFGWNRPFLAHELDAALLALAQSAGAIEPREGKLRSRLRVAALDGELFLHSSFPTDSADSVFFGPDTYRFARLLNQRLPTLPRPNRIIDMGAGSGAGGIVAARRTDCDHVTLVDVNPAALRLAVINAAAAGVAVEVVQSGEMPVGADLMVANPPYMVDAAGRAYRDGGDLLGGAVTLDWVIQGLQRLQPGGAIVLYTGAAFMCGEAPLIRALERACSEAEASFHWDEIDPDVFGEELAQPAYREVERIAAIGAVIRLRAD